MGKICEHTERWYSVGGMCFQYNISHDAVEVTGGPTNSIQRIPMKEWREVVNFIDDETGANKGKEAV